MQYCGLCKRQLDRLGDPVSLDCGGDCLLCMADAGDPDCTKAVAKIVRAVNNHAALIQAMERAADMLPANAACGVLRAALAKAKDS